MSKLTKQQRQTLIDIVATYISDFTGYDKADVYEPIDHHITTLEAYLEEKFESDL